MVPSHLPGVVLLSCWNQGSQVRSPVTLAFASVSAARGVGSVGCQMMSAISHFMSFPYVSSCPLSFSRPLCDVGRLATATPCTRHWVDHWPAEIDRVSRRNEVQKKNICVCEPSPTGSTSWKERWIEIRWNTEFAGTARARPPLLSGPGNLAPTRQPWAKLLHMVYFSFQKKHHDLKNINTPTNELYRNQSDTKKSNINHLES